MLQLWTRGPLRHSCHVATAPGGDEGLAALQNRRDVAVVVRRCGAVTSDEQLMNEVWPGLIVGPETVSQRVMLLRDALGDDSRAPRYIGRSRGRGYHLIPAAGPLDDDVAEAPAVTLPPILPAATSLADRPSHAKLTLLEP